MGSVLERHVHDRHPGSELVVYRTGHRGDVLLIGMLTDAGYLVADVAAQLSSYLASLDADGRVVAGATVGGEGSSAR